MESDYDPIFPVCGPNWKTYRSMYHALYCGDLSIEDVKEGSCETMVSKKNVLRDENKHHVTIPR